MSTFQSLSQYLRADGVAPHEKLVEGFLCRSELTLLSATAKTGKTWLALHLGLSVAMGRPFLGKLRTNKARVLLVQTEVSHSQFRERILKALELAPEPWPEETLLISSERFRIDTPKGIEDLKNAIVEADAALLILDPFYTLHRGDEDSASSIAPMLTELKQLCLKHNVACLLIHHQGKGGENIGGQTGHRARGSSALADVPDNLVSLGRTKTKGVLTLSSEFRNMPSLATIQINLSERLEWSILGEAPESEIKESEVTAILRENGETGREELIKLFCQRTGLKERMAEEKIRSALQADAIAKRKAGRKVFYSIANLLLPTLSSLLSPTLESHEPILPTLGSLSDTTLVSPPSDPSALEPPQDRNSLGNRGDADLLANVMVSRDLNLE